jgi:hypothetical protein
MALLLAATSNLEGNVMAENAFANSPHQHYGIARGLRDGTWRIDEVIACLEVRMTRSGSQWQTGGKKRIMYEHALNQVKGTGYLDVFEAVDASKRQAG